MPTTYAHWRFGDFCIKNLPECLQNIVTKNREIFNYGVHGPDIFFYYKRLKHNDVNSFGSHLHEVPFGETLEKIRPLYLNADDKESVLSYLLGFLCHFALDSYCHGFIDRTQEVTKTSHGKIESQLDRHFLKKDGYNPVKKSVTTTLKPSRKIAHDIAQIIPELSEDIIYDSLVDQKFYLNILKDSNFVKRKALIAVMDLVKTPKFKELLLTNKDDPNCKQTNARIEKYFNKAVEHYPILAKSMVEYLEEGKELLPYFHNHFCPKEDYKEIPILSYEDELKYEVNDFQK